MELNYEKFELHVGKQNVEKYISYFLDRKASFKVYDSDELGIYYISKDEGIDFFCEKLEGNIVELKAIFIYVNNTKEGYKQFREELPFSIEKSFTINEVNDVLGKPDKTIEAIPIIKKNYSEIYLKEGYSIGIEYNIKDGKIKFIRIEMTNPSQI